MLAGELYDPLDRQLTEERTRTRLLLKELNDAREDEAEARARILRELIPGDGEGLWLQPLFYCDCSVVTRDVPAGVFAAGNPCRGIRQLETEGS